jgi:fluoride exporter
VWGGRRISRHRAAAVLALRHAILSSRIGAAIHPGTTQSASDARMWKSILAISIGAALGALLRWVLGARLNSLFPAVPPGTLAANLIGGYVIGVAIAFFARYAAIGPEWRLLWITGFCGGLTTFSTFSAELVTLLQAGRTGWALGAVALHVAGSVLMTFAGIGTVLWLARA